MSYLQIGLIVVLELFFIRNVAWDEKRWTPVSNTLRQIHVFFRHAERMPTSLYPKDPNAKSDFKDGLGRITMAGKSNHYRLGEHLRHRYGEFLSDDTNEVKARSSARDRCLESMQVFLAGLYKPTPGRMFEKNLFWQPVPISSVPTDLDGMLYEDAFCQSDDVAMDKLRASTEGREVLRKFQPLMSKLYQASGKQMVDWVSVRDLLDTLTIEKSLGLKIPDWADEATLKEMQECAHYTTLLNYKSDERIKFRAGLLLKDIDIHMKQTSMKARGLKLYAYASHDVLVAAFLSAFGAFNGLPVPPSTTVIVELHEEPDEEFKVKMFLIDNVFTMDPQPIHVQGCNSTECSLSQWQSLIAPFIPSDWRIECNESSLPIKLYEHF